MFVDEYIDHLKIKLRLFIQKHCCSWREFRPCGSGAWRTFILQPPSPVYNPIFYSILPTQFVICVIQSTHDDSKHRKDGGSPSE